MKKIISGWFLRGAKYPAQKCLVKQIQIEGKDEQGNDKLDTFDYIHMFAVDFLKTFRAKEF